MIIPYNVDVPMERWPWANWALIAANCITFVLLWSDIETNQAIFVLQRAENFRIVQLIGAMFGHGDPLHLIGNMLFLFVFGNAINAKLGHLWFLLLYITFGVVDHLIWLAISGEEAVLGASGAIFGIIGAFLVLYPKNDVSIFYWFGMLAAGSTAISAYWIILCYVGLNVISLAAGRDSGVSYVGHVVGAALGFGIAFALTAVGLVKSGRGEQNLIDLWRSTPTPKSINKKQYRDGYVPPPKKSAAPEPPPKSYFNELPADLPLPLVDDDDPPPPPKPKPRPQAQPQTSAQPSSQPRPSRPAVPMPPRLANPPSAQPHQAPPSNPRPSTPRPPQPPQPTQQPAPGTPSPRPKRSTEPPRS